MAAYELPTSHLPQPGRYHVTMHWAEEVGADVPVPPAQVRAQLGRIVASSTFVSSRRLCRFLQFIVERTLEQDSERLKEFVVAIEVFDRNQDYDPNIDSIVRVEARRLRNKLKAYYSAIGSADPVLIELRPGSYVPSFRLLNSAAAEDRSPARPAATTVAVLPFANLSPEPDQDFFCDGITEEIINALASLDQIAVVARTSSFQFKGRAIDIREVGHQLGAQLVVEGSVRKSGSRLRVTAQAIDAVKGYHLWSETYQRELRDVFAIQEEISVAIARTLSARLPARAKTSAYHPSLEAYTAYCKALHTLHQETASSLHEAIGEFRTLTRQHPGYAEPHAGIATVLAALSIFGVVSGKEIEPELRRHAEESVRLEPESSAGWTVMAGLSAHWEFDWAEAERRFRRAIALQPSNYAAHSWFGGVLAMLGRFDESESSYHVALKLNPLFPSGHARLGYLWYLRGDHNRAIHHLREALRLKADYPEARFGLGVVYLQQGRHADAVEILVREKEQTPPLHMGLAAGAYHRLGDHARCRRMLARLHQLAATQYVSPMARVAACVGMGDLDGAMDALAASIDDRAIFANSLNVDPFLDPLRSDRRFQRLAAAMNLPPRPRT